VTISNKTTHLGWLALLVFAGLGLFGYLMKAIDGFHATPGDLIDARFNSVILEHLYYWLKIGLSGHWTDIWSPAFFYPYQNVLAFSDNHFGSALSYIFLRYIGFSREISFSGWYVIGFCLNFICSYWVFKRFQFCVFSSSAAAFVFTFALPVIAHDGHSQFSYRFAIPLAFLAFWSLFNNRNLQSLAWLVFWVSFQFFCSIYLGIFLTIFLAVCLLPALLLSQKNTGISLIGIWSVKSVASRWVYLSIIATSILASLALGLKYQFVSQQYGFTPDLHEISQMIPRLESYFIADRSPLSSFIGKAFSQNLSNSAYRSEHQLFLGIGIVIFFYLGALLCWFSKTSQKSHPNQMQSRIAKTAFIGLLILFFGTLMYGVGSAWMQLATIPGLASIRAVTRIILIMIFPVSIMVAFACEKLYYSAFFNSDSKRITLMIVVGVILCSETVFFQNSKTPNEAWGQRIKTLEQGLATPLDKTSVLFVAKDETKPGYELPEVDAMIFAQDKGIPTVNGYSGKFPPGNEHNPIERCISAQERLEGYAKFTEMIRESTIAMIMRQIVKTPNIPCDLAK